MQLYFLTVPAAFGLIALWLAAFHAFLQVVQPVQALFAATLIEAGLIIEALAFIKRPQVWYTWSAVAISLIVSGTYNYLQVAAVGPTLHPWLLLTLTLGPLAALSFVNLSLGHELREYQNRAEKWQSDQADWYEQRRLEAEAYERQQETERQLYLQRVQTAEVERQEREAERRYEAERATVRALCRPPTGQQVPGLIHAECMTKMTLGAPILSPARMQLRHLTMFAAWESHAAIDEFLAGTGLGRALASGWHVRLAFQRRWGYVSEFDGLAESVGEQDPAAPVVAVTLARMKLPQVPRFIWWGRPVEELVRDHPGTTLAIAATRLPRTVSTFSVWTSQQEMVAMVRGYSAVPRSERHTAAMAERQRKDFHFEFTTLRFRPIAEYGQWEGRTHIVPS